jgi:uncharacterized delta-60 repeat protein
MEKNVQELLKDKSEDVVQFNFENNTSSPVAIDLFDTSSLLTIPTSGTQQTTYTTSNDLLPTLPPSLFALNPNNGTFIASDRLSPTLRLINTTTNTTENNFDNSIGFDFTTLQSIIQPDGKIIVGGFFSLYKGVTNNCIIRLNTDGSIDNSFDNSVGFNQSVNKMALQSDGKIICVGQFTTYKGVSANRIIRLNSDGTIDGSFVYGTGFNGITFSVAIQPDGKILVGGLFTQYKGLTENRIIRLNSDGSKDLTFDNSIGFDASVLSIAIQPDGKILVGGIYNTYKGVSANRIIRLNSDGTKDLTFDNSIGFNGQITSIEIQPDSKIICVGSFTTYKGLTENFIIRLNSDGSKDLTFDNSIGFNTTALSTTIQSDGKIIVGGIFTSYKGVTNNYIIRLNSDGSKDLTFDNSIGFNNQVNFVTLKPDGKILCVGIFSEYKGYLNVGIIQLNSDGTSASTLNIFSVLTDVIYNSNNNVFYGQTTISLYIISSDGQSIQGNISVNGTTITYNPNNNYLYISNGTDVNVLDCSTNTLLTPIVLGGGNATNLSEVTPSNEIYYFDNTLNLLQKIDCLTNTLVLINLALPNITSPPIRALDYYNGFLYVIGTTSIIDIVDTNTDTYFNSITIPNIYNFKPNYTSINTITNQLFITDGNNTNTKQFAVIDLPTNNFVSVNSLGGIGATFGVIYNSSTDSIYISGSLFSVVTFNATPFFISGSTNYNTFVNNLNFEPIFIDEIRVLTQNLTQLNNQVQFTKIDSNGNQIFFGEFPINKIDVEQNNNIATLELNGLVFDGRTYINQYVINPNQIVSFEIYYKQLDRLSATPTFPIFFKPKVQLKEYIRKDYNNYDVEM